MDPRPPAPVRTRRLPHPSWRALLAAIVLLVAMPAAALAWDSLSFSSPDESLMVSLTNQRRAASGLPALTVDGTLASEARSRSKSMGDRHVFSHLIPPDNHTVFDELKAKGYCYVYAAENFAWNTYPDDTATRAAQQQFESSSSHLANMLGKAYTKIGVGAYKAGDGTHVWTVIFTQPCGGAAPAPTSAPTPNPTATVRPTAARTAAPAPAATPTPAATPAPAARPEPTPEPEAGVLGETDGLPVSPPDAGAVLPTSSPLLLLQTLLDLFLAIMRMLFAMIPG